MWARGGRNLSRGILFVKREDVLPLLLLTLNLVGTELGLFGL